MTHFSTTFVAILHVFSDRNAITTRRVTQRNATTCVRFDRNALTNPSSPRPPRFSRTFSNVRTNLGVATTTRRRRVFFLIFLTRHPPTDRTRSHRNAFGQLLMTPPPPGSRSAGSATGPERFAEPGKARSRRGHPEAGQPPAEARAHRLAGRWRRQQSGP